jgi:3-oxoacyl-[acyl-carrier-protein] synthase III
MTRTQSGIGIVGTGRSLGSRRQTNAELCGSSLTSVTPEWIVERTGITQRWIVDETQSASSLALEAASEALENAGADHQNVGMTVASTFSGDYIFPPLSAGLHRDLGLVGGQFYDLQANCTGLVSALVSVSDRLMLDPQIGLGLVVGVEVLSPWVDYSDVETAPYFSDGAGAVVLGPVRAGRGVVGSAFFADTSNFESVRLRGGGSCFPYGTGNADPQAAVMEMNGLATWKQAVTHLPATVRRACEAAGWATDDVDLFIFHQANLELITYLMKKMKVPVERTFTNVQEIGNAGAASISIALADAVRASRLSDGQKVVLAGVGAGFTFGAVALIWDGRDHA